MDDGQPPAAGTAQRLRSDMLPAMVRHDLRASVAAMRMAAQTLRDERHRLADEMIEHLLAIVLDRCDGVMELMEQLNALAQLDGDTADVDLTATSLAEVVAATLTEIADPDQHVHVNVPPDVGVTADRFWLRRALANVVTNAQRYGGPRLWIDATREEEEDVVLVVSDDGPGIAPAVRDTLFEPFVSGPGAREQGGTGLGLAIVRASLEAMGCSIEHTPTSSGTQLRIRLPQGVADPSWSPPVHPQDVGPITLASGPYDHACLVYGSQQSLVDALASRVRPLLEEEQGAFAAIAAPARHAALTEALRADGVDVASASTDGRLVLLDVRSLVLGLHHDGGFDEDAFRAVIGSTIDRLRDAHGTPVLYSEMTCRLWHDGESATAWAVADAWHRLYTTTSFRLLCGYPAPSPRGDMVLGADETAILPGGVSALLTP